MDVHGPLDLGLHFCGREQFLPFSRRRTGLLQKQDLRTYSATVHPLRGVYADQWLSFGPETRAVPPYRVSIGHYRLSEHYRRLDFEHCCAMYVTP